MTPATHEPKLLRVAVVFGTRPEAIKLAPVIAVLRADARFDVRVILTGQHREMVTEIIGPLGIEPDVDLDLMQPGQSLSQLVSRSLSRLDDELSSLRPRSVIVQGDTSTAFAAGLASHHLRIPVMHVEAGLRSFDRAHPFPEETNRRLLSLVTDLHFAPTRGAAANLLAEGVPPEAVIVTGNTVIDALMLAMSNATADEGTLPCPPVLVTIHRRETWDGVDATGASILEQVLRGIREAAVEAPAVPFVFPVHPNPRVHDVAWRILGDLPNVELCAPKPYFEFVRVLSQSRLIATDSGGIQEEAPSFGLPVLVVRATTERHEALCSEGNRLVGTDAASIRRAIVEHLRTPVPPRRRFPLPSPFGDGRASQRIRDGILWFHGMGERPADLADAATHR